MEECLLKGNPLTDKNTDHSYLEAYTKLLQPRKNRIKNVLEIGVVMFGGGSSIMFHDYLENSIIYALDNLDHPKILDKYERIIPLKMDAYCDETIKELSKRKYDFITDDGSHQLHHQIYVASHYFPLLEEGGLLIIEDIQNINYCPLIISACSGFRGYEIHDLRSKKNRADDIFIVFFK